MADYTIYRADTGQILRTIRLPDIAVEPTVDDGEVLLDGRYSGRTHYIAEGAPVAFPENPDPAYTWDWDAKAWVDARSEEELAAELEAAWNALRAERDARSMACDWIMLPDVTLGDQAAWLAYRQALRDLPSNTADPNLPIWPEAPARPDQT